ncbi:MAG: NlpC/P60 family protein [Myxococcota bacterium]
MKRVSRVWGLLFALLGCGGPEEAAPSTGVEVARARPESCPETVAAPSPLPNVQPSHRELAYWIERQGEAGDVDAPLLTSSEIADHNRALLRGDEPARQPSLDMVLATDELQAQVSERLAYLREKFESNSYLTREGEPLSEDTRRPFETPDAIVTTPSLRVALAPISLRCGPLVAGFYTPSLDLAFDRNNCSTVRAQEPIEILAEWPGGMKLARTSYALGWIARDAPLSPEVPAELREAMFRGDPMRVVRDVNAGGATIAAGALLPLQDDQGWAATRTGFVPVTEHLEPTQRPLTRRAILTEAFALLDAPYGWGGHEGGRDCSRFLLDIFSTFGLHLPRHSGRQAVAGTFSLDVEGVPSGEKALLIDAALGKGVVLLHFPGHIMFYLGRNAEGAPMAIHSFSEYVSPCEGTADEEGQPLETLHRVDRIAVSDLTLGDGSSRDDFLARVTKVVVIGHPPGLELGGAASLRPAAPLRLDPDASCDDSLDVAVFRSPARPYPGQPLRVIVTSSEDPGPIELTLLDPRGERVPTDVQRTGGPPYGFWAEVERPTPGRWTAVLGDGTRIEACERFTVARFEAEPVVREPETPAWIPAWSWERDTENLFAAFVEQLFRDPVDDDVTWTSLQELLREPSRNLLHNHRSLGEDATLELQPDCADLPYFLRAYFAWKLRLPFAWRQCSRGREGVAPSCAEEPRSNLMPVSVPDELSAFQALIRVLKQNVHSSTQRTIPATDASDVYPVDLTRESLRPGTVFADPYGHILVVAAWAPQGSERYGVLVGADAQPDGTVGRRRFWRGSFLFDPDTTHAGSGFKAWRPVVYDRREETLTLLTNQELRRTREFARYSNTQYSGSRDEFYERMERLINPRPLEPQAMQRSLVDALEEAVARRTVSVQNGETFMAERGYRPIEMPEGSAIFQTEGPWEDFSTPSRDLRLLISIDAVTRFPAQLRRDPARFGVDEADADEAATALEAFLEEELQARRFEYRRSDGSMQALSLHDVVARSRSLEMAYNPNDCVERRWGAPEGSPEFAFCRRNAPLHQRAQMERSRNWFATRQRPAR